MMCLKSVLILQVGSDVHVIAIPQSLTCCACNHAGVSLLRACVFAGKVMPSYSCNWFTLLSPSSASLVLYCDQFGCGSR